MRTAALHATRSHIPVDGAPAPQAHPAATHVLLVLMLSASTSALGQTADSPPRWGDRVRITAPTLGITKLPARFRGIRRDTLLADSDSALYFPVETVRLLEASRGRSSVPVILGSLLGAVAGVAAGFALATECPSPFTIYDTTCGPAGSVLLGLGVGALAGAGVGVALRTERWRVVDPSYLQVPAQSAVEMNSLGLRATGPLDRLRVGVVPRNKGVFFILFATFQL